MRKLKLQEIKKLALSHLGGKWWRDLRVGPAAHRTALSPNPLILDLWLPRRHQARGPCCDSFLTWTKAHPWLILWCVGPRLWRAQTSVAGRGGQFTWPWGMPPSLVTAWPPSGLSLACSSLSEANQSVSMKASDGVFESIVSATTSWRRYPSWGTPEPLSLQLQSQSGGQTQTCSQVGELFSLKCQQTWIQWKRKWGGGWIGSNRQPSA